MTAYRITLHSPLGPRRGVLKLPPGSGQAAMLLLGRRSCLDAEQTASGCRLTGALESAMGPIAFMAELTVEHGAFDCAARTGKGEMRLTGTQMEGNEGTS